MLFPLPSDEEKVVLPKEVITTEFSEFSNQKLFSLDYGKYNKVSIINGENCVKFAEKILNSKFIACNTNITVHTPASCKALKESKAFDISEAIEKDSLAEGDKLNPKTIHLLIDLNLDPEWFELKREALTYRFPKIKEVTFQNVKSKHMNQIVDFILSPLFREPIAKASSKETQIVQMEDSDSDSIQHLESLTLIGSCDHSSLRPLFLALRHTLNLKKIDLTGFTPLSKNEVQFVSKILLEKVFFNDTKGKGICYQKMRSVPVLSYSSKSDDEKSSDGTEDNEYKLMYDKENALALYDIKWWKCFDMTINQALLSLFEKATETSETTSTSVISPENMYLEFLSEVQCKQNKTKSTPAAAPTIQQTEILPTDPTTNLIISTTPTTDPVTDPVTNPITNPTKSVKTKNLRGYKPNL